MSKKEDVVAIAADEDLITPERLAKGDLLVSMNGKGMISSAVPLQRFVIKELIRRSVLDHYHEIYGMGFLELRAAFRAPWAVRSCAVLLEQWGKGLSISHATDIYQNVCRGFTGSRGVEVIQFALETEVGVEEPQRVVARYSNGVYLEFFDKLVGKMDEERERIANMVQKYGYEGK